MERLDAVVRALLDTGTTSVLDLGSRDPVRGSSTQMAIFYLAVQTSC